MVKEKLSDDEICVLLDGLDSDLGENGPCFIVEHRIFDQLYYLASEKFLTRSPLVRSKVLDMLSGNLSQFIDYASHHDSNDPMQIAAQRHTLKMYTWLLHRIIIPQDRSNGGNENRVRFTTKGGRGKMEDHVERIGFFEGQVEKLLRLLGAILPALAQI